MAEKKIIMQYRNSTGYDTVYPKTTTDQVDGLQTALDLKENADNTILKQANVINNVTTESTIYPLSATQGKVLQTEINNLKNIGRFLAILDASAGTVSSQPSGSVGDTYNYKVGDYYRVGASGNYTPKSTSTYTIDSTSGSSNFESGATTYNIGDVIYCSNLTSTTSTWVKQASSGGGTVQDVTVDGVSVVSGGIASITGKQDTLTSANAGNNITITGKHGLPPDYTELLYLQTTGSQYINTLVQFNTANKIELGWSSSTTSDTDVIVAGTGEYGDYTWIGFSGSDNIRSDGLSSVTITPNVTTQEKITRHDITCTFNTSYTPSSISFGVYHGSSAYNVPKKYYFLKIYTSTGLVRNLIPAKNSDDVVGMYDLVYGQFYTNAGEGTFTAGPEVSTTISATVPTKTSQLTNDSGFLTQHQDISGKENTSNKVTSISSSSTDTEYPSAKCVYDYVQGSIADAIGGNY